MKILVEVADEVSREAAERELAPEAYVEMLIERGREAVNDRGAVDSAIERIRALRAGASPVRLDGARAR
jgi:hypothetical protein